MSTKRKRERKVREADLEALRGQLFVRTDDETRVLELLRGWAVKPSDMQLVVTFENGAWECVMTYRLIPSRPERLVLRGVGTSLIEAIANIDGNNVGTVDYDA